MLFLVANPVMGYTLGGGFILFVAYLVLKENLRKDP